MRSSAGRIPSNPATSRPIGAVSAARMGEGTVQLDQRLRWAVRRGMARATRPRQHGAGCMGTGCTDHVIGPMMSEPETGMAYRHIQAMTRGDEGYGSCEDLIPEEAARCV